MLCFPLSVSLFSLWKREGKKNSFCSLSPPTPKENDKE